jgi:hypothetical protein
MNTAAFALPLLYKAIQQFAKNLFTKDSSVPVDAPLACTPYFARETLLVCAQNKSTIITLTRSEEKSYKPVRVVRELEAGQTRSAGVGRMVISGRMADVCAELDRLASLEVA